MGSAEVLEALYPLLLRQGKTAQIRSENGLGFITSALQNYLIKVGIKPIQIYPGSLWENGHNERFNVTL
jgi:transposase InsO family protein